MIRQKQQTKGRILPSILHKSIAVLVLLFLTTSFQSTTLHAQQWEKFITISDTTNYANSILETLEGDIVVAGHIGDGASSDEIYITKLDPFGNLIWENTLGTNTYDEVRTMALTSDGGFILGGFTYEMAGSGNAECYLIKVSSEGAVEWEQEYGGDGFDRIHCVTTSNDGGYVFGGWINSDISGDVSEASFGEDDYWIVKVNATGNIQWDRRIGGAFDDKCYDITNSTDGGFVAVGTSYNAGGPNVSNVRVVKLDADGTILWDNEFGQTDVENQGFSIEPTNDDGFIISGATFKPTGDSDMYLLKVNANGSFAWSNQIGGTLGEWGSYAVQTQTGGYALAGSTRSWGSDSLDIIMIFTDVNGDSLNQKVYEGGSNLDNVNHMSKHSDGGFLIAAQDRSLDNFPEATSNIYILKTGPNGETLTTNIEGSVFWDTDGNCQEDMGEDGLNDWLVVLKSDDRTFYATTDINGDYAVLLDTGNYDISVIAPNNYWTGTIGCGLEQNLNVTSYYDTLNVDFSAEAETNCYYLEADISTPFLQACEDAVYTVRYCNTGTVSGFGTFAEIELDDDFVLNSVSQPYTLTGNLLTVGIGTVPPGACDSFQINVNLDCLAPIAGQTHGLELNMVPNLFCIPSSGWDNSSLSVDAECIGDSVKFTVTNEGSDMTSLQHYIIIIDDLVELAGPVDLPSGDVLTVTHLAEGNTLRLEAQQSDNHPGRSAPSVTVEGCSTNMSGGISLGYVNQFAEDDANAHRSDDKQESVESGLPPMLRAFPKGHHIENYIKPNQDIEYLIRFQNTCGDTVQQVIIENRIPTELDITTIQPGSSSHDYDFEIVGEGILRFRFNNLQLLDSLENEDLSHLFVKFRVSQKEDLEAETEIINQLSLHADGKDLVSNMVLHTVEKEIIYQPFLLELCTGTLYNDQFILQNDTVILDTISFGSYDLWEIAGIEVLPNAYTTIDTVLLTGIPYEGVIYDQDTTFTQTYPSFNSCDSMVTTNIMIMTSGLEDNETLTGFSLYPNPVNDELYLHYTLENATEVRYEIKEILTGKVIYKASPTRESAGEHYRKIDMKNNPVGTYIISIQAENDLLIQKLIKL